ncbi:MAG: hypothetical protein ACK5AZ_26890 [Bryobacteraceae bacterium]
MSCTRWALSRAPRCNDTQSAQSSGIGTDGRRAFSNFQVNGGAAFGNDIQLDGVSIQASAWIEVAVLPNTEGIQEVKTTVNNMSAEYGRSNGTVIISTKSGTNELHGSGQFRLRNEAINANRFENNAQEIFIPRAPFKVQNYSATLGGPGILPKLYNGRGARSSSSATKACASSRVSNTSARCRRNWNEPAISVRP